MKKLLLLGMILLCVFPMFAQDPYCCVTKGAVMTFTEYDSKGNSMGTTKIVYKDVNVINSLDYDVTMEVMTSNAGNSGAIETKMEVRNGNAIVNMGMEGMDVTASDPELMCIPNKLAVGYQLPLGDMYVDMSGFRVKSTITENEVVDREELSTPAGSFKCYVVKQTSESRVMGIKGESTIKTWYARGIGMVKQESYSKGQLVSSRLLTALEK